MNPRLPPELERIVNKTLEKDRELRYQHAADIYTDLKRLKRDTDSGRAVSAAGVAEVSTEVVAAVRARRVRLAVLAGAAILIAVVLTLSLRAPLPPPKVVRIVPLTSDGRGKPIPSLATDGFRLYFAELSETWSRSFVDDSNLSRWRATSELNRAQMLVMNYVYALPFFNASSNRFARNALGGWQISGITSFFTGTPVDIGCGITGFSNGIGTALRCNSIAPVKIEKEVDNDPQFGPTPTWFDGNTFAQPLEPQLRADGQPGMFGTMGRNPLTGPGRNNWDMALLKNFQLPWFGGEHSTLQFRWETFNTFNHPQWQNVNVTCNGSPNADGTPAFGRACGGHQYNLHNGQISAAWPSRIMQFALKLMF